ncbi:MAG TPA: UDP-N-acetylmuramoyl-tripeptide--D-alanyl-D-alanine ligase [bacterium]|nr:UDP-N-acetylmuramoyl-tripeptide--D-alanyl-D-alanine ligase [bacterium]
MLTHTMINEALARCGSSGRAAAGNFRAVTLDSRTARPGDIFCAFKGEKVDGHAFVAALCAKGVLCVGSDPLKSANYAQVADVTRFLAVLARLRRDTLPAKVVAITGSSGKTTTRQFATRMLALSGKSVHGTSGNLNNHLGLPLTLLNAPEDPEFIVLEMGMNHAGEIAHLCAAADPDAALITNIGFAHIGNFASRDDLAAAKLEIFDHSRGRVVADIDDPYIARWLAAHPERPVTTYSATGRVADLTVRDAGDGHMVLRWEGSEYAAPLPDLPDYMVQNFAAAAALTLPYVASPVPLFAVFDDLALPPYRGERVVRGEQIFIADCYNANPDSMLRSIENFIMRGDGGARRGRYLVLGDMAELGNFSENFHRELVKKIKTLTVIDKTFLMGEEFEKIADEFIEDKRFLLFHSNKELAAALPPHGLFLVKGSRRNHLETIFEPVGGR